MNASIAKNQKYDKNSSGNVVKSEIMLNQKLAEELHKSITRKFEKPKDYSSFKGNIWGAYLADIQFIYALLIFIVNMLGFSL